MTRKDAARAMLGFFDQKAGCTSETANSDELYQMLFSEAMDCDDTKEFEAVCEDVIRRINAVINYNKGGE